MSQNRQGCEFVPTSGPNTNRKSKRVASGGLKLVKGVGCINPKCNNNKHFATANKLECTKCKRSQVKK